jgi:hypothetical protein
MSASATGDNRHLALDWSVAPNDCPDAFQSSDRLREGQGKALQSLRSNVVWAVD